MGASIDPVVRKRQHLGTLGSKPMRSWIDDCRQRGAEIQLVCIEKVPYVNEGKGRSRHPKVAEAEDRWIVNLIDEGHRLLNRRLPETHSESTQEMKDAIERGRAMFGSP